MKALRDYIINEVKTRIVDEAGNPYFRDVRMYNNQFERSNNDDFEANDEAPFAYPCCFIEFDIQEVRGVALGVKYVDINIIFRLGLENYSLEREEDFDVIDQFDEKILGMRGGENDPVQFSSLQEALTDIDENHNNINRPVMTYKTTYTRLNGYTRKNFITKSAPTGKNVSGEII